MSGLVSGSFELNRGLLRFPDGVLQGCNGSRAQWSCSEFKSQLCHFRGLVQVFNHLINLFIFDGTQGFMLAR
jgi:hypothetical protein